MVFRRDVIRQHGSRTALSNDPSAEADPIQLLANGTTAILASLKQLKRESDEVNPRSAMLVLGRVPCQVILLPI